jgi:SAM-dependent methyltransferase
MRPEGADGRHRDVVGALRAAYDGRAEWRDGVPKEPWKLAERDGFLARVVAAGGGRLLEVGAGTGQDGAFFAGAGLDVTAVDLSPEMVARCRAKGLDAHVREVLELRLPPASYDAVWSMNCLLHVPNADLPAALTAIAGVLRPGGLFFLGVWGGTESFEGYLDGDEHVPPRFFAWRTDDELREYVARSFEVVGFRRVRTGGHPFQAVTLRRP